MIATGGTVSLAEWIIIVLLVLFLEPKYETNELLAGAGWIKNISIKKKIRLFWKKNC